MFWIMLHNQVKNFTDSKNIWDKRVAVTEEDL